MAKIIENPKRRQFMKAAAGAVVALGVSPLVFAAEKTKPDTRPSPPGKDPTREQIIRNLRRANQVGKEAMEKKERQPFGAVLIDADNETVLMRQSNIDVVNHAESTISRLAAGKMSPAKLWGTTLYANAEPCVMCTGTIYWANVGRIVFGMSVDELLQIKGYSEENTTMNVPSRYVINHGQKNIRIWGPIEEVKAEIAPLFKEYFKRAS